MSILLEAVTVEVHIVILVDQAVLLLSLLNVWCILTLALSLATASMLLLCLLRSKLSSLQLFGLGPLDLSLLHGSGHLHVFDFLIGQMPLVAALRLRSPKHLALCLCLGLRMGCLHLLPLVCRILTRLRRPQLLLWDVNSGHLHQHVVEDRFVSASLDV